MKLFPFICYLLFSTLVCCMPKDITVNNTGDLSFSRIKQVQCKADTTQSYMIYLPVNYNPSGSWPVIFCFDPHGNGQIPVDSLKLSAEKYGYIVVGSNNIHNGVENLNYLLTIYLEDVLKNYLIDEKRIYCCGFSGGGRIAQSLSLSYNGIKGIISCGAGFSSLNRSEIHRKINCYIIAGTEDFNYLEAVYSIQYYDPDKLNIIVELFEGKHTWPPSDVLEKAVIWFTLDEMKNGNVQKDEQLIKKTYIEIIQSVNNLKSKGKILEELRAYENGIKMLDGLTNIDKLKKESDNILNSEEYRTALKQFTESSKTENHLMTAYVKAVYEKDTLWWKNEIVDLYKKSDESINSEKSVIYKRIMNYMRLMCYMISEDALNKNNMALSEKILYIYRKIDPHNMHAYYFNSIFLFNQDRTYEAKESFKRSIELGFTDIKKAQKQLPDDFFK